MTSPEPKYHSINLSDFRSAGETAWSLPSWGHLISKCVMPLLISAEDRLFPVGTAFVLSKGVVLFATAEHNIREALKRCWRNNRLAFEHTITGNHDLSEGVGVWVLYHHLQPSGTVDVLLWPLETLCGPQPSDLVVCSPKAAPNLGTVSYDVSFDIPEPGTLVQCVGYSDFVFPEEGIPLGAVRNGTFDWKNNYDHTLWVIEGAVAYLFTQRFAAGYVQGPCFSISAEIPHGLSGGPAFSTANGSICGVNSAGATAFFGSSTSLVSPLFPTLFTEVKFGFDFAPNFRMNAVQSVAHFVARSSIKSRGTESSVNFSTEPDGTLRIGIRTRAALSGWVFDDFQAFQEGRPATLADGPVFHLKTNSTDSGGAA